MSSITKANVRVVCDLKKMLKHFDDLNFLKVDRNKFNIFYNGENLKHNIQHEWFISNSINCTEPSFLSPSLYSVSDAWNTFKTVKLISEALPCSIVGSGITVSQNEYSPTAGYELATNLKSCFEDDAGIKLQRYLICDSESSNNYFYKLQRDRHMWWKKFSASPGRFSLSQIFNGKNEKVVEIQAEFPWGFSPIEKIRLMLNSGVDHFKADAKSKKHVISSETFLERAVLTFLCDSYEGPEESGRTVLRFHRKLSPYKVSFAAVPSSEAENRNLKDLALLLTKQIRKNTISVLLLQDMCSMPVEDQLMRNDALGIPYTVILDENTLKTGLLGIRSRDTTLKEQSHVSILVSYVEKLMKNY